MNTFVVDYEALLDEKRADFFVERENGKNNNARAKYYSCAVFLSDGALLLPMTQMRGIKTEMRRTDSKGFARM